jgi:cell wall-associated NlpC family hydrolase
VAAANGGGSTGTAPAADDGSGMKQGWDGSVYWFRNESGEWRYTKYYDTYVARTQQVAAANGGGSTGTAPAADDGSGMKQGWDGSVYWFLNESGEWRYTKYYDTYVARTQQVAAANGGGTAATPGSAPAQGNVESAIQFAMAQLGKPYVWGGDGPDGYDCSGLVQQAFLRAGIQLPRVADDQYQATTPIGSSQLRRGDLVFWSSNGRVSGIHHVAIYLGDNRYIEAPHAGAKVRISVLSSGYYPTHLGRP